MKTSMAMNAMTKKTLKMMTQMGMPPVLPLEVVLPKAPTPEDFDFELDEEELLELLLLLRPPPPPLGKGIAETNEVDDMRVSESVEESRKSNEVFIVFLYVFFCV
jgi:hypothetical protein